MPIDFPAFGYAAAVAAGGVLGYVKSSKFIYNKQKMKSFSYRLVYPSFILLRKNSGCIVEAAQLWKFYSFIFLC